MRQTKDVTIEEAPAGERANRDAGKVFVLTEMSAIKAEAWATRMWLALARNNVDIPSSALSSGWGGLMSYGIAVGLHGLTRVDYGDLKPLWDEMLACCEIAPDPGHRQVKRRLVEDDIEEVSTIFKLRNEVIELHTGFSIADALSRGMIAAGGDQDS